MHNNAAAKTIREGETTKRSRQLGGGRKDGGAGGEGFGIPACLPVHIVHISASTRRKNLPKNDRRKLDLGSSGLAAPEGGGKGGRSPRNGHVHGRTSLAATTQTGGKNEKTDAGQNPARRFDSLRFRSLRQAPEALPPRRATAQSVRLSIPYDCRFHRLLESLGDALPTYEDCLPICSSGC